jgi:glycosyltransferase involved in cell wall biosynthesis
MPLVTVVIPTHSRTDMLIGAARSALNQTFRDIELLIVASAATFHTLATANKIASTDPRCRVVTIEKDSLAAARNAGIKEALGEWVAFLDDDDLWLPNKLERQLSVDADMVNCDFIERGGELDGVVRHIRPPAGLSIAEGFVFGNYGAASASGAMVRTDVIRSLNGFDEALNGCEDWDMWRRISWRHRVVFLDEALVVISRNTGSMQVKRRALFYKSFLMHTAKTIWEVPPHLRHMIKPLLASRWRSAISHWKRKLTEQISQ